MDLASWASLGTVIAAGVSVVSLLAVAWQLRSLAQQTKEAAKQAEASAEATRASVHLTLSQSMIDLDRFFVDRPELRGYVYGTAGGNGDNTEISQACALSEMFVDFIDCVVYLEKHLSGEQASGWRKYFEELMSRSEALQGYWRRHRHWYSPSMQEFLDPALARAESMRHEPPKVSSSPVQTQDPDSSPNNP